MFKERISVLESRLRQEKQTASERENQVSDLRFDCRSLKVEVTELKKDASAMSELLQEGSHAADKVFERENVVSQQQCQLKIEKEQVAA